MLKLGTKAPEINLEDVSSGQIITLQSFSDKEALLVMFICNHCPYVKHVEHELAKIGKDYASKNLSIVAISANDTNSHPDDSPENLKLQAKRLTFNFPYCYDSTQQVAISYTAACTPDFFLFNKDHKLTYRGQLDDSRPSNDTPVTGKDLRAAIDALLANKPVTSNQKPSQGCNLKWIPEKEPAYFS